MGDRANIVIEADNSAFPHPVFFYTHWDGHKIKQTLQKALLKGKDRWGDSQYLSRVIFCTLVGKDDGITGYGISTAIGDGERPLLCVHMEDNLVRERASEDKLDSPVKHQWTFQEFVDEKFSEK